MTKKVSQPTHLFVFRGKIIDKTDSLYTVITPIKRIVGDGGIYTFGDDIQHFVLMICNACALMIYRDFVSDNCRGRTRAIPRAVIRARYANAPPALSYERVTRTLLPALSS